MDKMWLKSGKTAYKIRKWLTDETRSQDRAKHTFKMASKQVQSVIRHGLWLDPDSAAIWRFAGIIRESQDLSLVKTKGRRWTSEIRAEKSFAKTNHPLIFSPQERISAHSIVEITIIGRLALDLLPEIPLDMVITPDWI